MPAAAWGALVTLGLAGAGALIELRTRAALAPEGGVSVLAPLAAVNDVERLIFDVAEALRIPVLVLALASIAFVLVEAGALVAELVRRRGRGVLRLEEGVETIRAALAAGDKAARGGDRARPGLQRAHVGRAGGDRRAARHRPRRRPDRQADGRVRLLVAQAAGADADPGPHRARRWA